MTVMALTDQLIQEQQLTAFMVTHDMEDAIRYGNRLIMLHQGKIVVDIAGEEKQSLTVPDLMALFHQNSGTELKDDQLLFAHLTVSSLAIAASIGHITLRQRTNV